MKNVHHELESIQSEVQRSVRTGDSSCVTIIDSPPRNARSAGAREARKHRASRLGLGTCSERSPEHARFARNHAPRFLGGLSIIVTQLESPVLPLRWTSDWIDSNSW